MTKTCLWIGAVVICIVGIALATPIVGLNFANILAFGTQHPSQGLYQQKLELFGMQV